MCVASWSQEVREQSYSSQEETLEDGWENWWNGNMKDLGKWWSTMGAEQAYFYKEQL
jgi:hypothetical protein